MTKRLLRLVLAASTLAALPLPAQLVPLRPTAGELTCFPELVNQLDWQKLASLVK